MSRIIDLSMLIEEGMQTFAAHWHPFVEITQLGRHGIENRETRKVIIGTHSGTHIDAPRHFIKDGPTIETISLDRLVGDASVLDFSALPDFHNITKDELIACVDGRPVTRIICRFDWDIKALGTNEYYSDHPFFSEEACQWLVDNGCKVIALDTPQPDNPKHGRGATKDAPNHKILLGNNVIIAECLVNIRDITQREVQLFVAPIRLKDGDGAPARIFVIEGAD